MTGDLFPAKSDTSEGGFVLIFRRLLDNPVFRSDAEAMAFALMILRAAWKPTVVRYKGYQISLQRGQLAMSVRDLADRLEWSKDRTHRFLSNLTKRDMIQTVSATGVSVISIMKYDTYQPTGNRAATLPLFEARQHRDSTATGNNEGNEGNKREANASLGGDKSPKPKVRKATEPNPDKPKRGTQLPANWQPTMPISGQAGEIVASWSPQHFDGVLGQFRDHHAAKGSTMKDWDAAFRTWVANEVRFNRGSRNNGTGNRGTDDGQFTNGMVRAAARASAEELRRSGN